AGRRDGHSGAQPGARRRAQQGLRRRDPAAARSVLAGQARNLPTRSRGGRMSCLPAPLTFRLVDGIIGWEADASIPDATKGLEGLDSALGISLARLFPGAVDPALIDACLPPARLARGRGPCEWVLGKTTCPVLLRGGRCADGFLPVFGSAGRPGLLVDPVALAARRFRVAVADRGARRVFLWTRSGERLVAAAAFERPGPLAFGPMGEL